MMMSEEEEPWEETRLLKDDKDDNRPYMQIKQTGKDVPEKAKLSREKLLVVACILLCELCERLTYYSVIANLVLYCTSTLKLSSSDASTVSLVFSGTVYLIPVIGGYVSDTVAGKYNTIFGSGLIYIVGLFLLPVSAVDYEEWFGVSEAGLPYNLSLDWRKTYFFLGLVLIAIGTGGIKANVGPFGAQQVEDLGPEAVQSFFNWFYWFINAGASIAYLGVAYIQQNISFSLGFLVPLLTMILAVVIFVAVKSRYINRNTTGSILQNSIGVCCATKCKGFDRSRKSQGGRYSDETVDGVISVLRVLPIFLFIIFFWAIYAQMQSTFFLQGERMDVSLGSIKIPVAALNVFNNIIIMLTIPVVDRVIYPLLSKYGRSPTQLQRIGFGFVLAGLSVVAAGVVEIYRKRDLSQNGGTSQILGGETFNASSYSVFLQVPQFALVGAGEVFASISGYEFAYSQVPEFMQGVVIGMLLMTNGLGFYVSKAILNIVQVITGSEPPDSWYPDELNEGKVENLFFLMAGLMAVNVIVFVIVARLYTYRAVHLEVTYDDLEWQHVDVESDHKDYLSSSTHSEHHDHSQKELETSNV